MKTKCTLPAIALFALAFAATATNVELQDLAKQWSTIRDATLKDAADRRKFLFYGFLAAWLLVCLYVVAVSLRERRLRGELDRVKRLVENREHDKPEQIRL